MGQQEALNPVLHVLQHPAVRKLVPGSLDGQPVQTLGWVVLNHLRRSQTTSGMRQTKNNHMHKKTRWMIDLIARTSENQPFVITTPCKCWLPDREGAIKQWFNQKAANRGLKSLEVLSFS